MKILIARQIFVSFPRGDSFLFTSPSFSLRTVIKQLQFLLFLSTRRNLEDQSSSETLKSRLNDHSITLIPRILDEHTFPFLKFPLSTIAYTTENLFVATRTHKPVLSSATLSVYLEGVSLGRKVSRSELCCMNRA